MCRRASACVGIDFGLGALFQTNMGPQKGDNAKSKTFIKDHSEKLHGSACGDFLVFNVF